MTFCCFSIVALFMCTIKQVGKVCTSCCVPSVPQGQRCDVFDVSQQQALLRLANKKPQERKTFLESLMSGGQRWEGQQPLGDVDIERSYYAVVVWIISGLC